MKRLQKILPLTLVGLGILLTSSLAPNAWAAEATEGEQPVSAQSAPPRKMLYLFSADFPSSLIVQYPAPPVQETRFWQLLDREMSKTQDLTLTENVEDADYRIELRCGGIFNCSKLVVDIKNPDRLLLASFNLKDFAKFAGLGPANLEIVAAQLTVRLDERLKLLEKGGYGHTD